MTSDAAKENRPGKGNKSFIDPQGLMAIRNVEFRARAVMEGFRNGLHRSPYHGFSVEFTEYRAYTVGDDPRYLDWRLYARSDRFYLKKFQDETNLRCFFLLDNSKSMGYSRGLNSKSDYAKTLAASLAYFLHHQGDAIGLLSFDEQARDYLPARNRPGHLRQFFLLLEKPVVGRSTNLDIPLERILQLVRKRSLMVILSDFLAPIEPLERELKALRASGHELFLFQILDPAELTFDPGESGVFRDLESDREMYIDVKVAQKDYRARLEKHNAAIRLACQRLGAGYKLVTTQEPFEAALLEFVQSRGDR